MTELGISCEFKQVSDGVIKPKRPTFTAITEIAGVSRVMMGGYHIQADNVARLHEGRKVAVKVWLQVQAYFDGTASVR